MNSQLQARLRRCAELAGSGDALAQKTAIPRRTLETYLAGAAEPKVSRLVAIADAVGVSVDWLATGREPMMVADRRPPEQPAIQAQVVTPAASAIDEQLLDRIAGAISEVYRQEDARIAALFLVRLAGRWYADLVATCDTPEERAAGLKVMLQQLRRELRTPSSAGEKGGHRAS